MFKTDMRFLRSCHGFLIFPDCRFTAHEIHNLSACHKLLLHLKDRIIDLTDVIHDF